MDPVKLQLVHLSAAELKANSDKKIVVLPEALQKELANKFYGGYASGTAPMGYVPNAIILKE